MEIKEEAGEVSDNLEPMVTYNMSAQVDIQNMVSKSEPLSPILTFDEIKLEPEEEIQNPEATQQEFYLHRTYSSDGTELTTLMPSLKLEQELDCSLMSGNATEEQTFSKVRPQLITLPSAKRNIIIEHSYSKPDVKFIRKINSKSLKGSKRKSRNLQLKHCNASTESITPAQTSFRTKSITTAKIQLYSRIKPVTPLNSGTELRTPEQIRLYSRSEHNYSLQQIPKGNNTTNIEHKSLSCSKTGSSIESITAAQSSIKLHGCQQIGENSNLAYNIHESGTLSQTQLESSVEPPQTMSTGLEIAERQLVCQLPQLGGKKCKQNVTKNHDCQQIVEDSNIENSGSELAKMLITESSEPGHCSPSVDLIISECHSRKQMVKKQLQCRICNVTLRTKTAKRNHEKEHTFCCDKCPFKTHFMKCLYKHITRLHLYDGKNRINHQYCGSCIPCGKCDCHLFLSSRPRKSLKCKFCGKILGRPAQRMHHEETFHSHNPQPCTICGQILNTNYELKEHEARERTPFVCGFCEGRYKRKHDLANHICKIHLTMPSKERKIEICKFCGWKGKFLRKHISRKHTGEVLYKCDVCLTFFLKRSLYLTHVKNCVRKCDSCGKLFDSPDHFLKTCFFDDPVKYETEQKNSLQRYGGSYLRCKFCGQLFTTTRARYFHEDRKHSFYPQPCSICGATFNTTYEREIHEKNERPFCCDICGNTFVEKFLLFTHIMYMHLKKKKKLSTKEGFKKCKFCNWSGRSLRGHISVKHRGIVKFECDGCHCEFVERWKYAAHMKKCPRTCQICDKVFDNKKRLYYHLRQCHNITKSLFPCQVCKKVFSTKSNLNFHLRTHHSKQKSICNICGKDFVSKYVLKDHINVLHNKLFDKHECTFCGKVFNRKNNLQQHKKTHHKNNKNKLKNDLKCNANRNLKETSQNINNDSQKAKELPVKKIEKTVKVRKSQRISKSDLQNNEMKTSKKDV